jgi:hypothetical protein
MREAKQPPEGVIATCRDWYDGERSAMFLLWRGRPFRGRSLLAEARKARKHLVDSPESRRRDARLAEVEEYAAEVVHHEDIVRYLRVAVRRALKAGWTQAEVAALVNTVYHEV